MRARVKRNTSETKPNTNDLITGSMLSLPHRLFGIARLHFLGDRGFLRLLLLGRSLLSLLFSLLLDQLDRQDDVENGERDRNENKRDDLELKSVSKRIPAWGTAATSAPGQSRKTNRA